MFGSSSSILQNLFVFVETLLVSFRSRYLDYGNKEEQNLCDLKSYEEYNFYEGADISIDASTDIKSSDVNACISSSPNQRPNVASNAAVPSCSDSAPNSRQLHPATVSQTFPPHSSFHPLPPHYHPNNVPPAAQANMPMNQFGPDISAAPPPPGSLPLIPPPPPVSAASVNNDQVRSDLFIFIFISWKSHGFFMFSYRFFEGSECDADVVVHGWLP